MRRGQPATVLQQAISEQRRKQWPTKKTDYERMTAKAEREKLELAMLRAIRLAAIPEPRRQYKFHPTRDWLFDFAWPHIRIAVEVDGGTWAAHHGKPSGHISHGGYENDRMKDLTAHFDYNWAVVRVTGDMVEDGRAVHWLQRAFAKRRLEMRGLYLPLASGEL